MGKWAPLYLDLFLEMDGANIGSIYIAVNGKAGATTFQVYFSLGGFGWP